MTSSPRINTPTGMTTPAAAKPLRPHPAHTLLSRAHSPESAARIFTDKVQHKPLLLQPSTTHLDKRALRRHVRLRKKEYYLRKQKPKPLSAKEKRDLGLYKLRKEEVRYEIYRGLHEMWNGYMLEVLGLVRDGGKIADKNRTIRNVSAAGSGALLASADFHGAELTVVRSKDAGKVGIKGIVVRDTKFTFVVVTERDEVKTLPKRETIFRYEVVISDDRQEEGGEVGEKERRLVFELHGSQFEVRPAERANRKFKWKRMDYL